MPRQCPIQRWTYRLQLLELDKRRVAKVEKPDGSTIWHKNPTTNQSQRYKSVVKPALTCCAEYWRLKKQQADKLSVNEMRKRIWSAGVTIADRIPNRYARAASKWELYQKKWERNKATKMLQWCHEKTKKCSSLKERSSMSVIRRRQRQSRHNDGPEQNSPEKED